MSIRPMGLSPAQAVAAGSGTYRRLHGNRIVALGDSTVQGTTTRNTTTTPYSNPLIGGRSWPHMSMLASTQGAFRMVYNAGLSGDSLEGILSRITAEVLPWAPDYVAVLGGTNNISAGDNVATLKPKYIAIYDALVAAGIEPIICTITPRSDQPLLRPTIVTINHWLRSYARSHGWNCVDFYAATVDATTGGYKSGYDNGDGLHPSVAGHKAMAVAFAAALDKRLPSNPMPLAWDNVETINKVQNGLFITDTNADGVADNWTASGTTAGVTNSLVTDAAIAGKWQKSVAVATAGTALLTQGGQQPTVAGGAFVPGDTMIFMCRIKTVLESGSSRVYFRIHTQNADGSNDQTPFFPLNNDTASDYTDGWLYYEFVVPAGVGRMYVDRGLMAGSGEFSISQVTWINKTQLGLL